MKAIFTGILLIANSLFAQAQTQQTDLDVGNVLARVASAGMLFFDGHSSGFIVPRDPTHQTKRSVISLSTLWVAGIDSSEKLRLSAQMYRQMGMDFQSGPVAPDEQAEIIPKSMDKLWKIDSWDITSRNIVDDMINWPVTFTHNNKFYPLAPFTDWNKDGYYDINGGDMPPVVGDQFIYSVYNDLTPQSKTGGKPVGVDIRTWVFGYYRTGSYVDNAVAVRYVIINRQRDYKEFYASVLTDFDIGNYLDDYIGTDTSRNMIYAYNADNNDEFLSSGYGNNPPAVATIFIDEAMECSAFWKNDMADSVTGNPKNEINFFHLMKGLNTDGSAMINSKGKETNLAYEGDPIKGRGWNMQVPKDTGNDYRMLGTVKRENFKKGDTLDFTVLFLYAKKTFGGNVGGLEELQNEVDKLWSEVERPVRQPKPVTGIQKAEEQAFDIYPNPADSHLNIDYPQKGEFECNIFSGQGQLIHSTRLSGNLNSINIISLPAGCYFIQLKNETGITVKKFVKQ